MDRTKVRNIAQDAEAALAEVGRKHGVNFSYAGGRFSDTCATLKFEAADMTASGEILSKSAQAWKRQCKTFGFEESDLGRTFRIGRSEYTIRGLTTRRHKFPIDATRKDGKAFKMTAKQVLVALGKVNYGSNYNRNDLTDEVKKQFLSLACQLSPENLSCDGELPAAEVRRRRAALDREWQLLEIRVGRRVTESEVWK